MKSTPKIHLKRPWRPALLLGVATTLAAGAWLLGATAANAAVGTDLGKVALNPGSGANTLTPTWSTLEGCPAGFQGSADLEIVINSASNPRNTVSNNVSGVSAPFSGTLQASMGDIKSAFGFANGSTQEWVVFCDANPNVGGSAKPVMDTYVTWSADGSSYTETNTPPATPTATALTASPSPAKAGQNVTLTSTVTAASGTPVGTVQFKDGGTAIGSPVTVNASGVATTTTTFSATGTHTLSAVFTPADSNAFQPSTGSLDEAVVPGPASTTTALALSATRVTYGHEQAGHVSVTVTSPSGTPGGTVTVKSGTATACTITLASGTGSCTLSATKLPAGTAHLTATYNGTSGFTASTSPAKTLTVAKAATKTALSMSAARVTFGHEQAERLTVTVAPQFSGTPGGKVTVKTGRTTVCTITLGSGKGHCTLTPRQLRRGTYTLIASYPGNSNFTGSASARKTLVVR